MQWALLGLVLWGLLFLFVHALMRMASSQDRAARRAERMNPFVEDAVTGRMPFVEDTITGLH